MAQWRKPTWWVASHTDVAVGRWPVGAVGPKQGYANMYLVQGFIDLFSEHNITLTTNIAKQRLRATQTRRAQDGHRGYRAVQAYRVSPDSSDTNTTTPALH